MKKLTAIILCALVALSSLAQKPKPQKPIKTPADSIAAKRVKDSIRSNEPLFSRNDVLDMIGINIEGYTNAQRQFIKSRFEEAILKDDNFNGVECNLIINYAIKIIAGDMKRMLDAAEERKRQKR
jgi:hypothetical protein